jgi:hypothetical protein
MDVANSRHLNVNRLSPDSRYFRHRLNTNRQLPAAQHRQHRLRKTTAPQLVLQLAEMSASQRCQSSPGAKPLRPTPCVRNSVNVTTYDAGDKADSSKTGVDCAK